MPRTLLGSTYGNLVGVINQYTNRSYTANTNATTGLSTVFAIVFARMAEKLRTPEMETTLSLTGSDFPYSMPGGYLGIRSVLCTRSSVASALARTNLLSVRNKQNSTNGIPTEYCTKGNVLEIGPSPASTDTFEVVYYAQPEFVSASTDNNTFTNYYPHIVVAGVLAEAYNIIQDESNSAKWEAIFQQRLADAQQNADSEVYSGNLITMRNS